jgi:hypothetical protein
MKNFGNALDLRNDTKSTWNLLADFAYENDKYIITLSKGFVTDGASIPRAFWSVVGSPFEGAYVKPSIIHDGLYTIMQLPRKECDKLLKEMMVFNGVSKIEAEEIYLGVRGFGGMHWKKDNSSKANLVNITVKGK